MRSILATPSATYSGGFPVSYTLPGIHRRFFTLTFQRAGESVQIGNDVSLEGLRASQLYDRTKFMRDVDVTYGADVRSLIETPPEVLRHLPITVTPGVGGAADDVAVTAPPCNGVIEDVYFDNGSAVVGASGVLRTASGGGGTALTSALSAANANVRDRTTLSVAAASRTFTPGQGLFFRRSNNTIGGTLVVVYRKTRR
jgi:hypothetical protein